MSYEQSKSERGSGNRSTTTRRGLFNRISMRIETQETRKQED